MRTRPLVALLGIAVGTAIAFACWKAWRAFVGEPATAPIGVGDRSTEVAAPPTAKPAPQPAATRPTAQPVTPSHATAPTQPTPPPMPFGTVFDPLAAVEDTPSLYRDDESVEEDEVASVLSETGGSAAAATELAEPLVEPPAETSGGPSLLERFGSNAAPTIDHGVCPEDHPVKGNSNSMIYHLPGESSYAATIPEVCFSDAAAAEAAGFRPRKR
jgi:hypothetical protein